MIHGLDKKRYSVDEVRDLINESFNYSRKSFMEGEFIFHLEDINGRDVQVKNTTYNVSKLMNKDNTSILVLQMAKDSKDINEEEMYSLTDSFEKGIRNSDTIKGAIIVPPDYYLNLMYAKLDTSSYEEELNLTDEDINMIDKIKNNNINKYKNSKISKPDVGKALQYILKTDATLINLMKTRFVSENNLELLELYMKNTYGILIKAKCDINSNVTLMESKIEFDILGVTKNYNIGSEIDYNFTNTMLEDKPKEYKDNMVKAVNKMQKVFDSDRYLKSLMNNNIDLIGIEKYIENTYGIIVCAKTDINNFVKLEVLGTNSFFVE